PAPGPAAAAHQAGWDRPAARRRARIGPRPDQPVAALRGALQGRAPCAPRAVPGSRLRAPDRSSSGGHLRSLGEAGRRLLIAGGEVAVRAGGDELPVGGDLPGTVRLVPARPWPDERGDLVARRDPAACALVVQAVTALAHL